MIVLGVIAAIDALHRGVKIGPLDPAISLAIPLIGIAGFTIVIYASWRARRRPDAHKRLIPIATSDLVAAAFGLVLYNNGPAALATALPLRRRRPPKRRSFSKRARSASRWLRASDSMPLWQHPRRARRRARYATWCRTICCNCFVSSRWKRRAI